jgi:hypothetical protein
VSLATRLLGANPGAQVSSALTGALTTPGAKGVFQTVPPGTFISLATINITSATNTSSVSFTNIPSVFPRLQIRGYVHTNRADVQDTFTLRFNGDSGASNYSTRQFNGSGGLSYSNLTSANDGGHDSIGSTAFTGLIGGNTGVPAPIIIDIANVRSDQYKGVLMYGGEQPNSTSDGRIGFTAGNFRNTNSLITSITFHCIGTQFKTDTKIALYGIKGE